MRYAVVIAAILFMQVSCCCAEGLSTLIEVGKGQAEIQKAFAEETRIFNGVKKAVQSSAIKNGQTNSEILSKYGEPVVSVRDYDTDREKWIYKPAKSSFSEGERIYLFFDKNGVLVEVKVIEK
jgi:hypothetical protein